MNIQSLKIFGLHGRRETVYLPIEDNRIIVVGVNGIGKTTALNIFYYLITQQWSNLLQIDFEAVELTIDQQSYTLMRSEVESFMYDLARLRRRIPPGIVRRIEDFRGTPAYFALFSSERLSSAMISELSILLKVSPSMVSRVQADLRTEVNASPELFNEDNRTLRLPDILREKLNTTVLYLPTYRRIEKELKHIRRSADNPDDSTYSQKIKYDARSRANYLEMAEFGMADVDLLISKKCEAVNRIESNEFKELIADYLSRIINNQVRNFDVSVINGLDESEINRVLNRVQDENLKPFERRQIQDTISRISKDPLSVQSEDIYVGQLFFQLMKMAERLEREERSIHSFIRTVNDNYLVNKKLYYSREKRTIGVLSDAKSIDSHSKAEIKFSDLSSGEKQIVSVFCHLYLGESKSYFVLIDEPELSLSIDWQEHFLSDILSTGVCTFLFAVTHSPFTSSGGLRKYRTELAVDIEN